MQVLDGGILDAAERRRPLALGAIVHVERVAVAVESAFEEFVIVVIATCTHHSGDAVEVGVERHRFARVGITVIDGVSKRIPIFLRIDFVNGNDIRCGEAIEI